MNEDVEGTSVRSAAGAPFVCLPLVHRGLREPDREPHASLGEIRARYRDEHLCLKCDHHFVCGMAKSLDPNLLVTITSCLGFASNAGDDTDGICELTPIEPLTSL